MPCTTFDVEIGLLVLHIKYSYLIDTKPDMPTSLKTIQTRSNEETIDEYSSYSDSEYNIELVKRNGSSLVDLQEESSITSAKSTMSGTTRRSRWAIPRHKKRKYSKRKNKEHKKYRSLEGLNNSSKDVFRDQHRGIT